MELLFIILITIFVGLNILCLVATVVDLNDIQEFLPFEVFDREFKCKDLTGYLILKFIGIYSCFILTLLLSLPAYLLFLIGKLIFKVLRNPLKALDSLMRKPINLPKFKISIQRKED